MTLPLGGKRASRKHVTRDCEHFQINVLNVDTFTNPLTRTRAYSASCAGCGGKIMLSEEFVRDATKTGTLSMETVRRVLGRRKMKK